MGDDDDRDRLLAMTELEREETLADRRDARAKIQDRKRIIQMAKEKKARDSGALKKKFKPSDATAGRKSGRVAGADAREPSKTKKALEDIAKKKRAAMDRRVDDDDDDDDSDDYDSDELEDEDLTGILPTREKASSRARGRARAGASDDEYSDDDEEDDGGDRVPAAEAQIRKIILKRETLEKWVTEPYFEQCAPKCMVRIGIERNRETGENKYVVAEIVDVAEEKHGNYVLGEYSYGHHPQNKEPPKKTGKWLILRYGDASTDRAFSIDKVSNAEVTAGEYVKWCKKMEESGRRMPQLRDVAAAEENIKFASSYRYTSEDVQKMIQKKREGRDGLAPNLAMEKETIRRLIARAKAEGDDEAVETLTARLEVVMETLTKQLDKGGRQATMANINKRNNQLNDANLSRIASEQIARAASGAPDKSADDPFSRRKTKAATYYTINRDAEAAAAAAAAAAAGAKTDDDANAKTDDAKAGAAGKKGPGSGLRTAAGPDLRSHAVVTAAKLSALVAAHSGVTLKGVEPSLAAAPDPTTRAGVSVGLLPALRRGLISGAGLTRGTNAMKPTGRTYSIQEYQARQGIEQE